MNITILNGNPDQKNMEFDRYLDLYRVKLHKTGHYIRTFLLREMTTSETRYIFNSIRETDLLVLASPIHQGNTSVQARRILDELIMQRPAADSSPAGFMLQHNSNLPMLGVILQKQADMEEKDLLLSRLTHERIAANLHTVLSFYITTETGVTDAACKTFQSFDYRQYIESTCNDFLANSSTTF